MSHIAEQRTAWGERQGIDARTIPLGNIANVEFPDGTLAVVYRQFVCDGKSRVIADGEQGGFLVTEPKAKVVTEPLPGRRVWRVDADVTEVERLFFSQADEPDA